MNYRYNGLGGGFAGYGIYPKYKDKYALHMNFLDEEARKSAEVLLFKRVRVIKDEAIPHRKAGSIDDSTSISWRYFVEAPEEVADADDYIVNLVMSINGKIPGAFVFSSGKNMGVFKAVGYPKDVAGYFALDTYSAYIWLGHGRYPTNTPGWWGGAHPFNILDWSVVHNGEISSYGTNRNFLEMWGYRCTLLTDTEILAYLFDLLVRKHHIPLEYACRVVAPPFWKDIQAMENPHGKVLQALRMTYGSALVNGPFSIVLATSRFMLGLSDRIKLRPLIAARKSDRVFVSSEECAIKAVCPEPEAVWAPRAGEPTIAYIKGE